MIKSSLNIICLETEAFYKLVEEVVSRVSTSHDIKEPWIDDDEAMKLLGIKSKTTLQKFRDQGKIRFSKIGTKMILYCRESILSFIQENSKDTF